MVARRPPDQLGSETELVPPLSNPDTVLICYDGSDRARWAIDAAGAVISARRAVVLNVGPPLTLIESVALTNPGIFDFERDNTAVATDIAEEGAELARRAGFDAKPNVLLGAPVWGSIVSYAGTIDATLIVLGSRDLTPAGQMIRGSVSHQVAQHAQRPVFIVPQPRN